MSKIILTDEGSTPSTPSAGTTVLYSENGTLKVLDPSGVPLAPVSPSIFTAGGDLLYASAPNTPRRLGIGTAGQVLTVNGGGTAPEWQDAAGGAGSVPFVAGPSGSGAQYATIQAAITAANAAVTATTIPSAVVLVLPGSYTETLTLPKNVSLAAIGGLGTVFLTGSGVRLLTLTSTDGYQSVSGIGFVGGNIICDASGASTATVLIENCFLQSTRTGEPAIGVLNAGWSFNIRNTGVESSGQSSAFGSMGDVSLEATSCKFSPDTSAEFRAIDIPSGGINLQDCELKGTIEVANNPSTVNLTDTRFAFLTTPNPPWPSTWAVSIGGGTTLRIHGYLTVENLDPTGNLTNDGHGSPAAFYASPGVFLGSYRTANLPYAANDGPLAYSTDENVLCVRQGGLWKKVATLSSTQTWTGVQSFYETSYLRATSPDSANASSSGSSPNFNLVDNTVAPLIRMDASPGGVRTVSLYNPGGMDLGKQWTIHDSARDATANNIQLSAPAGATLNGTPGPTTLTVISINGGAVVVRVSGAGAWETIGI